MLIKPKPGLSVRHHATRELLPADGVEIPDQDGVPTDPYWAFLLRHGDVEAAAGQPPAAGDDQAKR